MAVKSGKESILLAPFLRYSVEKVAILCYISYNSFNSFNSYKGAQTYAYNTRSSIERIYTA